MIGSALKARREDFRTWIAAVLLFMISYPMWFWTHRVIFLNICIFIFFIVSVTRLDFKNPWLICAYVLQIIFLFVLSFSDGFNIIGLFLNVINAISFSILFGGNKNYWRSITDKFTIILAVLLIPSIVEHIMITFVGIDIPYHYITECPTNPGRDYDIYNFNAVIQDIIVASIRFSGFYDEPGVVGNIVMVLLYIQKFNLRKWYNIVLLTAGILSFSLAFYLSVVIYFVIEGKLTTKLAFVVVTIVAIYLLYNNPMIYDVIFSRMVIKDGQLTGYNRENLLFQSWFHQRSVSDYFLWGYSGDIVYAGSWKWALVQWGVMPCFLYLFFIIRNAFRIRLNFRDILLVSALIIIVFIQRPFFYSFFYVFLIVVPQLYLSSVKGNSFEPIGKKA